MSNPEIRKKLSKKFKGREAPWAKIPCSEETKKKISESNKGTRNGAWNGGTCKNRYYGYEFSKELKQKVKDRDNNICQVCSKKVFLVIHHIDYNKRNHNVKNLISLCKSCHSKTNFNRPKWKKQFLDKEEPDQDIKLGIIS